MAGVAVEGEAERALRHALADDRFHRFEFRAGRRLAVVGVLAHDVAADGGVAHQDARVDAETAVEDVEVLGERGPPPRDAGLEALHGDRFDARQHHGERLVVVGARGGQPERAVAEDHRRHAVVRREGAERVPGDLSVEVAMVIDEPGRDRPPVRVDGPLCRAPETANLGHLAAFDADVGVKGRHARAVDHEPVSDEQVVHLSAS